MSISYGRYALAATWYQFILKERFKAIDWIPMEMQETEWSKEIASEILDIIHKIYGYFMQNHKI